MRLTSVPLPADPAQPIAGELVPDQGPNAYFGDSGLSISTLDKICTSARHCYLHMQHGEPDTAAFLQGRALHCRWLEHDKFDERFLICEASTRNTNIYKDLAAKNPGRDIILAGELEAIDAACRALDAFDEVARAKEQGLREVSIFAERRGIRCKARPDILLGRTIYDIKFTNSVTPDKFRWAAKDFGFARRAAWYMDLATAATGELVDRYVFVPVSKDGPAVEGAPHPIEVYELEADWIAGARLENDLNLGYYASCVKSGRWPGPSRILSAPRGGV